MRTGVLTAIHIFMETDYCQVDGESYPYTNTAELHMLNTAKYYMHFAKRLINLKEREKKQRGRRKTRSGSEPNACSFYSLQPPSQFILLPLWFCDRLTENCAEVSPRDSNHLTKWAENNSQNWAISHDTSFFISHHSSSPKIQSCFINPSAVRTHF